MTLRSAANGKRIHRYRICFALGVGALLPAAALTGTALGSSPMAASSWTIPAIAAGAALAMTPTSFFAWTILHWATKRIGA